MDRTITICCVLNVLMATIVYVDRWNYLHRLNDTDGISATASISERYSRLFRQPDTNNERCRCNNNDNDTENGPISAVVDEMKTLRLKRKTGTENGLENFLYFVCLCVTLGLFLVEYRQFYFYTRESTGHHHFIRQKYRSNNNYGEKKNN